MPSPTPPILPAPAPVPAPAPASVHAVVLAAGTGSRMRVLTAGRAKALLPVCNRPMLFYPLLQLVRAAVTRVTVLADPENQSELARYVADDFRNDPAVRAAASRVPPIVVRVADPDAGTADALRSLVPLPCNDTLVLAADVVAAPLDLPGLLRKHRATRSACTALLAATDADGAGGDAAGGAGGGGGGGGGKGKSGKGGGKSGGKSSKSSSSSSSKSSAPVVDHYAVLSPESHLLGLLHPSDVTGNTVPIRPALLSRYAVLHVRTDLRDPHAYALHTAFLQRLLALRPAVSSVRFDLVPYLARRQHALSRDARALDLPLPGPDVRVSAHVVHAPLGTLVARANTAESFRDANVAVAAGALDALLSPADTAADAGTDGGGGGGGAKKAKKRDKKADAPAAFASAGERTSVTADCAVGANVTAGDRVSLKRTVVGADCALGTGAKLNGCVLMNGVRIGDGANLANCVVAADASVGAGAVLKDCRVAAGLEVDADTQASDRDFVAVDATAAFDLGDDIEFC